jgi:signal transduction histidine kinase
MGAAPGFAAAVARLRVALDAPEIDRAELRDCVERIDERFAFMSHVLETGREQAHSQEPVFQRERLREIVEDEARLVRAAFPDRAEQIAVDVSGVDAKLVVDADAKYLRQAFANILKNAVEAYDGRASGDGAAIAIRVGTRIVGEGTEVAIDFADQGCGMSDVDVGRVFIPFGSAKPGGTGFGLFIARKVARSVHGGELGITSAVGVGTTVTVTLPLRHETERKKRGTKAGTRAEQKKP